MLNAECVDSLTKKDNPGIGGNEQQGEMIGVREDVSNEWTRVVAIPHVLGCKPVTCTDTRGGTRCFGMKRVFIGSFFAGLGFDRVTGNCCGVFTAGISRGFAAGLVWDRGTILGGGTFVDVG